jgi:hypothetical protein
LKQVQEFPVVWLIGGSSKLGLAIADHLEGEYRIVSFSRRTARAESESFHNIHLNLANIPRSVGFDSKVFNTHKPRAIVFSQWYRPDSCSAEID